MSKFKGFLQRKDIEISLKRYGIDALGAMAQGLFCTLLVGTILNTLGTQLHIGFLNAVIVTVGKGEAAVSYTMGGVASAMVGPAMAVAIGYALHALASLIAAPIGKAATAIGYFIMWATELQPFLMGVLVSVVVGIVLTLPISSAAICAAFSLTGLAGGAAVAGCCANMVGFAVISFRENGWGGLVSQGLGTSMLQMGNIVRNPKIWIPAIVTSAITGPISTCIFKMQMNGTAVSSGMGTCGLVGPIGVWTGWVSPSAEAVKNGAAAITPTGVDWLGMVLICFVLPAVICWALGLGCRKLGWIKDGDMKLD